ncbi:hypothetical protein FRC12_001946 [Ceratobasidium sp. 428]|nr:hypothetical protein FRC12_001946 [Ceratobasidium sp. 428]
MPREVLLAPGGSPFVQNTHSRQNVHSDTDTSLPELSSRYFRTDNNPDNLNSSRALVGLEDISTDMDEDDSPMRFRSSVSDEMLMGVKGGEFLVDDSAMGFDTSLVAKPFESRSKLSHSTMAPAAVPEEPEPEVVAKQSIQTEKPRRKSTRSRSKSPSKKSVAPDPVAVSIEHNSTFPCEPIETMTEESEPVPETVIPEPEVKPRRTSPRKARTRPPSAIEAPPAFPITSSAVSSSNPFLAASTSEMAPPPEPALEPSQQAEADTETQAAKPKRASRTVGRSKSKTRSKNALVEEDQEMQAEGMTISNTSPFLIENEHALLDVDQAVSPSVPQETNVRTAPVRETSPVVPPEAILPPAFIDRFSNVVKTTTSEPPSVHARAESGPAPFKFQALPSTTKSRSKSLTPSIPQAPFVLPTISSTLATLSLDTPPSEETPKEPTEEEEAEAVASALRILRRDSSIFPRLRQSIAPVDAPDVISPQDGTSVGATPSEPVHKRTRVGRPSRARGGAGVTTGGGRTRASQVIEEEQAEAVHKPEGIVPQLETPRAEMASPDEEEEAEQEQEVEDIVVPVNFGSRTPSPAPESAPAPIGIPPPVEAQSEPSPQSTVSDTKIGPTRRSRASAAPGASPPSSTGPPTKPRAVRASLPAQTTRATTRVTRMSEGRPTVARNVGNARSSKPQEPELVEEKEDSEMQVDEATKPVESIADVSASSPAPAAEEIATVDDPVASPEPTPAPVSGAEPELEHTLEHGSVDDSSPLAPTKPSSTRKAPGTAGKGAPQRVPQRSASATAPKPGARVLVRTASATQELSNAMLAKAATTGLSKQTGATLGKGAPPTEAPSSGSSGPTRPQRTATASSRKPSPSTFVAQKPPSTSGPNQVAAPQEDTAGSVPNKEVKTGPKRAGAKSKPETQVRPTRTMPKRATTATSREQTTAEPEGNEEAALSEDIPGENGSEVIEEPTKVNPEPIRAGPFEHTHSVFQPILNHSDANNSFASSDSHTSPRPNKRPASPEPNSEHQIFDSPSKRVRFSAELEAGPTPRAGPSRVKPKPSLKPFAKPKFVLKVGRPKRTLARTKPPSGSTPSYAAPLKRTISERVDNTPADPERPPLSESRVNTRSTNKPKPTVPVEFTFRSDLRMKPPVEVPLPNAIPIALPMPDFVAAHAAAEAANLARRERTQEAFLTAQAELEAWRESKHEIGSVTARRAAERAVFDAALKVKEAEAERMRLEAKRLEDEKEAAEIKEMRKRMVPKANPVPEWYKHIGQNENEAGRVGI